MKRAVKTILGIFILICVILTGAALWGMFAVNSMIPEQVAKTAQANALPRFSMRGITPNLSLNDAKSLRLIASCETQGKTAWCDLSDPVVAGTHSLRTHVTFENGLFNSIVVTFGQGRFAEVSDAITNAYGKSCRFDMKELQNAFGASFTSIEATWCFDGGQLQFLERSREDFRESVLVYAPHEPKIAPKKFTPDKL